MPMPIVLEVVTNPLSISRLPTYYSSNDVLLPIYLYYNSHLSMVGSYEVL
jgi:hypothetical protein